MVKKVSAIVAIGAVAMAASMANAEISQRDQERGAQSAYGESVKSYNEAAQGFQRFQDAAEAVRDGAVEILKELAR